VSEPGAVATGSSSPFFQRGAWSGRYRSRFWHGPDSRDAV